MHTCGSDEGARHTDLRDLRLFLAEFALIPLLLEGQGDKVATHSGWDNNQDRGEGEERSDNNLSSPSAYIPQHPLQHTPVIPS